MNLKDFYTQGLYSPFVNIEVQFVNIDVLISLFTYIILRVRDKISGAERTYLYLLTVKQTKKLHQFPSPSISPFQG